MKRAAACGIGTVCFFLVGMPLVFSETSNLPATEETGERRHKFEKDLGVEISHITYKEPGIMEEKGMMSGIAGSFAYRGKWMLKAEGRMSYGQVDYDGELQDGTPYTINDIDDYIFELRGLIGPDLSVTQASRLTPYIGLGYRYLADLASKDPAGYDRESNYIYTPIGIEAVTRLDNGWSVGLTAEFDIFWWGRQISHTSGFVAGLSDLENTQRKGYGARGSVKLAKKGGKVDFTIEPFVRYWNIEESDLGAITYYGTIIAYGYEPDNESTEIGCRLTVNF